MKIRVFLYVALFSGPNFSKNRESVYPAKQRNVPDDLSLLQHCSGNPQVRSVCSEKCRTREVDTVGGLWNF